MSESAFRPYIKVILIGLAESACRTNSNTKSCYVNSAISVVGKLEDLGKMVGAS